MGGRSPLGEQWKNADRYTLSRVHSIDSQSASQEQERTISVPINLHAPARAYLIVYRPRHPAHTTYIQQSTISLVFIPVVHSTTCLLTRYALYVPQMELSCSDIAPIAHEGSCRRIDILRNHAIRALIGQCSTLCAWMAPGWPDARFTTGN